MAIAAEFIMRQSEHLLPPNATVLEKALSYSDRNVLSIPTPLADLWRWDTCPTAYLPWLAWALGVDLWDPTWDETKKRNVIRNSFAMKRLKGTLGGQRTYLNVAGSTLVQATRPPAKNYLGKSTTPAEREALLDTLPQIRIHPEQVNSNAGWRAIFNWKHGRFFRDQNGKSNCFPKVVDTKDRLTTTAEYVHNGVTQQLAWADASIDGAEGVERIMIPSTGYRGTFMGAADATPGQKNFIGAGFNGIGTGGKRFLHKSDADSRLVTLNLNRTGVTDALLYRFPVIPSMTAVDIVPFREYIQGSAPYSAFCDTAVGPANFASVPDATVEPEPVIWGNQLLAWGGKAIEWRKKTQPDLPALAWSTPARGRKFLVKSTAKYRVYDVVRLKPPSLPVNAGSQSSNFMSRGRFGIHKYTAELLVKVPGNRPKWATGRYVSGTLFKAPKTNLENALFASRVAKSARDTVLMNTRVYKPLQIGQVLTVGADLILGQYTRA